MILVESLLYDLDFKLNKLATNDHQEIPLENKIVALNLAQIKLILLKIDPNNVYKLGFDAFKKRYEDLQFLVEPFHDHPLPLTLADKQLNKWTADLSKLSPRYMFYVDSYCTAHKGNCGNHVLYVNKDLTKHADITVLLANNMVNPSFEYQETFCTISKGMYETYSDGDFTFDKAYISYIRYPLYIDYPGYINLQGAPSTRQDSELPAYLENELVDMAVKEIAFATENLAAAQSSIEKLAQDE